MDVGHLSEVVGRSIPPGPPARVTDRRLGFNVRDEDGSRVANLVAEPGSSVYGVVYRLPWSVMPALDRYEGVPDVYVRDTLWVEPPGRPARQAALAYVAAPDRELDEGSPAPEYLARILSAAEARGLPADYIDWMRDLARGEARGGYRTPQAG
jgi:cation transport regulator ChaC